MEKEVTRKINCPSCLSGEVKVFESITVEGELESAKEATALVEQVNGESGESFEYESYSYSPEENVTTITISTMIEGYVELSEIPGEVTYEYESNKGE